MQPSSSNLLTPSTSAAEHNWTHLPSKQGFHFSCVSCEGKIWLNVKGGLRCEHCLLVCHNSSKCQERARALECRPGGTGGRKMEFPQPNFDALDDVPFVELDTSEIYGTAEAAIKARETAAKRKSATEEQIQQQQPQPSQMDSANKSGVRRRRLAEKLHTISAHVKQVGTGYSRMRRPKEKAHNESESPESPSQQNGIDVSTEAKPLISISQVLDQQFLDSLEGLPNELKFKELRFEPGNAYNPQVILEAKEKGQDVFAECGPAERKANINGQIDRVQTMIEKVTRERRLLPNKSGDEFDQVDNRLQALALIMLLYCSGLSDCVDKEEAAEIKQNSGMKNPTKGAIEQENGQQ